MKDIKIILVLVFIAFFTACGDCLQTATGVLIDKQTNLPIDSVFVKNKNEYKSDFTYSDKNGNFTLESISGGLFSCPPMTVILSKEGYETMTITVEAAKKDTIKLVKVAL